MNQGTLDYEEALRIVLDASSRLPAEDCSVVACLGRILAKDLVSTVALPPFDNSAMDGFALHGDTTVMSAGTELDIEGEQAAGDGISRSRGGAWEIMTGARVPDGLDRVIPVEQTERVASAARIRLLADVTRGENIRTAGSDVQRGETVLIAGTTLAPQHLMCWRRSVLPRYPSQHARALQCSARGVNSLTIRHRHWHLAKSATPMDPSLPPAYR